MHYAPQTLRRLLCTGLLLVLARVGFCQPVVAGPDQPIDMPTRTTVVHELIRQLNAQYVFPKVAAQLEQVLQTRLAAGDYDRISSSKAFADTITAELQRSSHDKHLRLFYRSKPVPATSDSDVPTEQTKLAQAKLAQAKLAQAKLAQARLTEHGRRINFGFGKPERLVGNIGYLRIDEFMPVDLAAQTATAALTYLRDTDALILDLRGNRGGEPAMVAYLASYFFGPDPVHLNDMVRRAGQPVASFWTHKQLPGPRYMGKPLYILTSKKTFSAGEELAYDLQSLERATVVGEPTAGGAHSGELVRISAHFDAFIPIEYARNPITQTNWEGTGVPPNVKVSATQARQQAHVLALETRLRAAVDVDQRRELVRLIEHVRQQPAGQ